VIVATVPVRVIGIDQSDVTVEMPLVQRIETESVVARLSDRKEIVVSEADAIVVVAAAVAVLEIVAMTAEIDVTADATTGTVANAIEDVSGRPMTFLLLDLPPPAITRAAVAAAAAVTTIDRVGSQADMVLRVPCVKPNPVCLVFTMAK
jgi:hypothetical protein